MYTLYGAPLSYFSGKARAYLDYSGLPYEEVLAGPDIYQTIILPRVGWPVMPVVTGPDDELLQDTSDIIDTLDPRSDSLSVYPDGPRQKLLALLYEVIGDEWLINPAMHYRWNYNRDFAYSEFGKVAVPEASPEAQYETGKARAKNFEGALPFLGITDATIPGIERAYEHLLDGLNAHFAVHPYLLGTRPSIGDFGLYGPLYAHLYRDPASGEIMKARAPEVARWVERMTQPDPGAGEFLPDDEIPQTALGPLRSELHDFLPLLTATAKALTDWAADQPSGAAVPRALGPHPFEIGGAKGHRMLFPFNLWMLQRPLDLLGTLQGDGRSAAQALLSEIGASVLADFPDFPRLERRNYKLTLA